MSTPAMSIDALVGSAMTGHCPAVENLLALIQPRVVRYCRARVGRQGHSFASADDVAQEVCIAVLTALPSYRDQGRPFLAFVYGIAAHKVADAHRSAARNRSEPVPEFPDTPAAGDGPEQYAMRGELSDQMARLMSMLPPKQREILLLRVVVGLSAEETADAVNSTPGAVRVAQHRALNRLRKALASDEVLDPDARPTAPQETHYQARPAGQVHPTVHPQRLTAATGSLGAKSGSSRHTGWPATDQTFRDSSRLSRSGHGVGMAAMRHRQEGFGSRP